MSKNCIEHASDNQEPKRKNRKRVFPFGKIQESLNKNYEKNLQRFFFGSQTRSQINFLRTVFFFNN